MKKNMEKRPTEPTEQELTALCSLDVSSALALLASTNAPKQTPNAGEASITRPCLHVYVVRGRRTQFYDRCNNMIDGFLALV
jgi:hypothetical protein